MIHPLPLTATKTPPQTMRKYITSLFDASGKSLNGKVQLAMDCAHHNCHGNDELVGYEQTTTIYVRDNGTDPVAIVDAEESDNQIDITVFWEITDEDAEDEGYACDWDTFEVYVQDQGYDLETLLATPSVESL
jgi:hypothetical protein